MTKFKPGDRVRCFQYPSGTLSMVHDGKIRNVRNDNVVDVMCDDGIGRLFHEKQCRRLVKRQRNEFHKNQTRVIQVRRTHGHDIEGV